MAVAAEHELQDGWTEKMVRGEQDCEKAIGEIGWCVGGEDEACMQARMSTYTTSKLAVKQCVPQQDSCSYKRLNQQQ